MTQAHRDAGAKLTKLMEQIDATRSEQASATDDYDQARIRKNRIDTRLANLLIEYEKLFIVYVDRPIMHAVQA